MVQDETIRYDTIRYEKMDTHTTFYERIKNFLRPAEQKVTKIFLGTKVNHYIIISNENKNNSIIQ